MRYEIVVNPTSEWHPNDYDLGLLNGSEEMVVLLARYLARRHHEVVVYCNLRSSTHFEKLDAVWVDRSLLNRQTHSGVLIAFKDADSLMLRGFSKRFLWTADANKLTTQQWAATDRVFGLSEWHEKELKSINPLFQFKIGHIKPGIERVKVARNMRNIGQCLYASSPDRGLDFLLSGWKRVLDAIPDAILKVTYQQKQSNPFHSVEYTGRLSKEQMDDMYLSSDVLLYPCSGGERFCISALKAQYFGVIPVVIPTMALSETVQFGIKTTRDKFFDEAISLIKDERRKVAIRKVMVNNLRYDIWETVAKTWEKLTLEAASCGEGNR